MKSEIRKLDSTKREIQVEAKGEIIKNKFDQVFKKIGQEAKIPGFRPGNAPRDILEKYYSSLAHEQVIKELIPELYNQAVEKEGLDVVDSPNIFDVKLDRDNLFFKAEVEVRPEIKLKKYKGLKVTYKKIEVTSEDIKRSLKALEESRKLEVVDDNVSRGLGYPSLSELERTLEKQIFIQKENLQREKIESGIIEELTKDIDFKLPPSLIKRQLEDLIRQAKVNLAFKGVPRQEIDAKDKELTVELEPQAKKQVQVYLILAEIAKKEGIPIDEHLPNRVMEFLLKEADWEEGSE